MRKTLVALVATLAAVTIACGSGADTSGQEGTPKDDSNARIPINASSAPAPAETSAAPAPDPNKISDDGTFAVPSQVRPGRYRAVVPADSSLCYWERLKDTTGEGEDIIANGTHDAGQQVLVTIKSSDKYFRTEGCGTWTKIG